MHGLSYLLIRSITGKCFILLVTFFLIYPWQGDIKAFTSPPSLKRIVFLGNSITYSGKYIRDIESYFRLKYPLRELEFINVGLSSETLSGLSEQGHADGQFPRPDLHERLERVLTKTQPDLVFACYGMNDGIYMPFDDARFRKFKEGIHRLHGQVITSGAEIVHLTPPLYDEIRGGIKGYDDVLDKYSQWLIDQGKLENWKIVDIHGPMKNFLQERRKSDPTFSFAADGVHPDDHGHWLIAQRILIYLGEKEVESANNLRSLLLDKPNADRVIKLVEQRQNMTRDAWLSATGHKRPGIQAGLPLEEAKEKAAEIENQIRSLVDVPSNP